MYAITGMHVPICLHVVVESLKSYFGLWRGKGVIVKFWKNVSGILGLYKLG